MLLGCGIWTLDFSINASLLILKNDRCSAGFDPATFALTLTSKDKPAIQLSVPNTQPPGVSVNAKLEGSDLILTFAVTNSQTITFLSVPPEERIQAFILPTFQGRYVPSTDAEFQSFLKDQGSLNTTADLSMPFIGLDLSDYTVTILLENPFNNILTFNSQSNRLTLTLAHEFTPNRAPRSFTYRVHLGPPSVIEPARYYRNYLIQSNQFVSFAEKAKRTPACERLFGALQAYIWGDGLTTSFLEKLKRDGIDRALLCTGDLNSLTNPAVAEIATRLGYLLGPYDSYHSIHSPSAKNTWDTAQFDQALYDTGAIVRKDGKKKAGFQKRGYNLSPKAAEPYVARRVDPLLAKIPFSAWFVDCDAAGELFDNYDPGFPTTQAEDARLRCDRLQWLTRTHGLIVGSEDGCAYAAGDIHFAHGMLTPVIGWGDPDLKDRKSAYWLGAYWPPTGPTVFTRSVPLKPFYQKLYFDPRYRLPLYQIVFHDSVITTHHWSAASLKFSDQLATTELLELLYDSPPLYHLNEKEYKLHRARILAHYAAFSPLHRLLVTNAMTDFQFLTPDREVQRTSFANGARITANFSAAAFKAIPPRSVLIQSSASAQLMDYTPAP
jgi:hypothetical protein